MLIFVIHENLMVRTYFKPVYFEYVLQKYGIEKILFNSVMFGISVFLISGSLAAIYIFFVRKICLKIFGCILECFEQNCERVILFLEHIE